MSKPQVPSVELVKSKDAFGVLIETDKGILYHSLFNKSYEFPIFWTFKGHRWMILTRFYLGDCTEEECSLRPILLRYSWKS